MHSSTEKVRVRRVEGKAVCTCCELRAGRPFSEAGGRLHGARGLVREAHEEERRVVLEGFQRRGAYAAKSTSSQYCK